MALSYATPPSPATLPRIEDVPAAHLTGRQLNDGWRVVGPLNRAVRPTGGFFSYSYSVGHDDGREAFMKALNIAAALALAPGGDVLAQLKMFADTFAFERDLLAHCVDKRLSRIIKLLAHGDVDIPEAGVLRSVPYLIFELADGDINEHRAKLAAFDLAWVLRVLKHSTLGIEQLHSAGTAHQDLRPSNVLTQDGGKEMKLGDLGRADRVGRPGPTTGTLIAGAVRYAPPEQLYEAFDQKWESRRAADVYHIGSLAVQLFLGQNVTILLQHHLPPAMQWGTWTGDFASVLPYLRTAHGRTMVEFENVVRAHSASAAIVTDLVQAVRELTDPDPAHRGHPKDRAAATSSYAVRRYVSLFNRLAAEAELKLKRP
jgi:eukaryotic-like serine/threonine-protein kinase